MWAKKTGFVEAVVKMPKCRNQSLKQNLTNKAYKNNKNNILRTRNINKCLNLANKSKTRTPSKCRPTVSLPLLTTPPTGQKEVEQASKPPRLQACRPKHHRFTKIKGRSIIKECLWIVNILDDKQCWRLHATSSGANSFSRLFLKTILALHHFHS